MYIRVLNSTVWVTHCTILAIVRCRKKNTKTQCKYQRFFWVSNFCTYFRTVRLFLEIKFRTMQENILLQLVLFLQKQGCFCHSEFTCYFDRFLLWRQSGGWGVASCCHSGLKNFRIVTFMNSIFWKIALLCKFYPSQF